jgi:hypothetical protein
MSSSTFTVPLPLRIVVIADRGRNGNVLEELNFLPEGAQIVGIYKSAQDLLADSTSADAIKSANALFNVSGNAKSIAPIIPIMPSLCWIHTLWAGLDALWCPEINDNHNIRISNAKGLYFIFVYHH